MNLCTFTVTKGTGISLMVPASLRLSPLSRLKASLHRHQTRCSKASSRPNITTQCHRSVIGIWLHLLSSTDLVVVSYLVVVLVMLKLLAEVFSTLLREVSLQSEPQVIVGIVYGTFQLLLEDLGVISKALSAMSHK